MVSANYFTSREVLRVRAAIAAFDLIIFGWGSEIGRH